MIIFCCCSVTKSCLTICDPMDYSTPGFPILHCLLESESRSVCVQLFATPWTIQSMEFSRQNTGVCILSLLQGIFPTQGSNLGLLNFRQILYQLSYLGNLSMNLLKLMSIESVMPSNHLNLSSPSPPDLSMFQHQPLFASSGQSIGASASISVLPMNIQG